MINALVSCCLLQCVPLEHIVCGVCCCGLRGFLRRVPLEHIGMRVWFPFCRAECATPQAGFKLYAANRLTAPRIRAGLDMHLCIAYVVDCTCDTLVSIYDIHLISFLVGWRFCARLRIRLRIVQKAVHFLLVHRTAQAGDLLPRTADFSAEAVLQLYGKAGRGGSIVCVFPS